MGLEQAETKGEPGVHLFHPMRRQLADEVLGQILVERAQLVEKDDGWLGQPAVAGLEHQISGLVHAAQFGFIFGLEGMYRRNHEVIVARLSVVEIALYDEHRAKLEGERHAQFTGLRAASGR